MYSYRRNVTQAEIDAYIDGMPLVIFARAIRHGVRALRRSLGLGQAAAPRQPRLTPKHG